MVKKILSIGFMVIIATSVFALSGCSGYETEKFDSLEEMQAVMDGKTQSQEGLYFFDFNQEGVKEAGKYEATKKRWRSDDAEYTYFRYSIWYDIEYEIGGQMQERKLVVIGTYHTHSLGPLSKNLRLPTYGDEDYFYYFELENMKKDSLTEQEKKYILSICEQAINNRYQFSNT